jgi:hypothetical protein
MSVNTPHNWVVIKITGEDPHYRVLGGWSGGYLDGDSWRLNSGIVKVVESPEHYEFYGSSGSVYKCRKTGNRVGMNIASVIQNLKRAHGDKISVLEEDTDYTNIDWVINK